MEGEKRNKLTSKEKEELSIFLGKIKELTISYSRGDKVLISKLNSFLTYLTNTSNFLLEFAYDYFICSFLPIIRPFIQLESTSQKNNSNEDSNLNKLQKIQLNLKNYFRK